MFLDRFFDSAACLRKAVARGQTEKVKRLLAQGANANDDTEEMPLLHQALINGDAETANLLVAAGATQDAIVIRDTSAVGYLSISCLRDGRFVHHAIHFGCELSRRFSQG